MRRTARIVAALRQNGPDLTVHVVRAWAANPTWTGMPVLVGNDLVLFRNVIDFRLDGYSIMRTADIDRVHRNGREDFLDHVLTEEGLAEDAPPVPLIQLTDWMTVFEALVRLKVWVLIECEDTDEVLVGPVVAVHPEQGVGLNLVEPDGYKDDQVEWAAWDAITLVRFGDRYLSMFHRYADR